VSEILRVHQENINLDKHENDFYKLLGEVTWSQEAYDNIYSAIITNRYDKLLNAKKPKGLKKLAKEQFSIFSNSHRVVKVRDEAKELFGNVTNRCSIRNIHFSKAYELKKRYDKLAREWVDIQMQNDYYLPFETTPDQDIIFITNILDKNIEYLLEKNDGEKTISIIKETINTKLFTKVSEEVLESFREKDCINIDIACEDSNFKYFSISENILKTLFSNTLNELAITNLGKKINSEDLSKFTMHKKEQTICSDNIIVNIHQHEDGCREEIYCEFEVKSEFEPQLAQKSALNIIHTYLKTLEQNPRIPY